LLCIERSSLLATTPAATYIVSTATIAPRCRSIDNEQRIGGVDDGTTVHNRSGAARRGGGGGGGQRRPAGGRGEGRRLLRGRLGVLRHVPGGFRDERDDADRGRQGASGVPALHERERRGGAVGGGRHGRGGAVPHRAGGQPRRRGGVLGGAAQQPRARVRREGGGPRPRAGGAGHGRRRRARHHRAPRQPAGLPQESAAPQLRRDTQELRAWLRAWLLT